MFELFVLIGACGMALLLGGWEWMLPCLVCERKLTPPIASAGLLWLAAFRFTGDRRLFFCYVMMYAVYLACSMEGPVKAFASGGLIVALFLGIRGEWQAASMSVLTFELVIAAAILAICVPLIKQPLIAAAVGSILAFASLGLN